MPERKQSPEREVIPVTLPKAAARQITRAAARRHKTKSGFMRDAAIEAAEKVLAGPAMDGEPVIAAA